MEFMTEKELRVILEKAIWAPSGDNCQPWLFDWNGEVLNVLHDANRAQHPLDPQGAASNIAMGCLIEAIDIAASEVGYATQVELSELKFGGISRWAQIRFAPALPKKSTLSDALLKRCTDRRPYQGGMLTEQMFQKNKEANARLHFLAQPSQELIDYIVNAEQLLADHPEILPATMHWVRFSVRQARRTQDGVSWRNMGTKFWEVPMMPLLRNRRFLQIAKLAIGPQHRARVTKQLQSSAGIVCVSAPNPMQARSNVVHSGRLMMNAWLSLTSQSYGVQPLTLASLTGLCAREGIMPLPEKWIRFFHDGEKLLQKCFSIPEGNTAVWMIRTGRSTPLPNNARTFRRSLDDILSIKS